METLINNHIERILVIQTAFLGDVLLTFPIAHHLKKINPAYKISFLIKQELQQLTEIYPVVDEFILIDKTKYFASIVEVLNKIRNKFDVVISPHRSARSAIISYLSNSPVRISFDKSSLNFLYTHLIQYRKNKHEIERNLDLLKFFTPKFNWKEKIELKLDKYILNEKFMSWKTRGEKIVVIAPGTVWENKKISRLLFWSFSKKIN